MSDSSNNVPSFTIGESDGPLSYIETALPVLAARIGSMSNSEGLHFCEVGLASAHSCLRLLSPQTLSLGKVDPVPEVRTFWNLCGDLFLGQNSKLVGVQHLAKVMSLQEQGFNVVIVQNHRSGSDMFVMETLIRRHFGADICSSWSYMAGHVVNLFLIPLMFSAALRRFQIFSVKYQSMNIPGIESGSMKMQNFRAMRSLREHVKEGGKTVVYYPEGGRGTGGMMKGAQQTSCIPESISRSGKPLVILPTFIKGGEQLLPQMRGPNEFNEVLKHMQPGNADLIVGAPILWEELVAANSEYDGNEYDGNRDEWNVCICDTLLGVIASLGPEEETGPYSQSDARIHKLTAPFIKEVVV